MVYDPDLLDRLEALPPRSFEGVIWRHMFNDLDPARANTRGARWNPPGVAAIYASLERETALAEADYAINIQPVRPRATRQLYRVRVSVERLVDLSDRAVLADLGIEEAELGSVDQTPCRIIGGACHWLDADGLLVPSARATGINLVLFVDKLDVDAPFEVQEREDLPPTSVHA